MPITGSSWTTGDQAVTQFDFPNLLTRESSAEVTGNDVPVKVHCICRFVYVAWRSW